MPQLAIGLVRWAKEQVEDFSRMFCMQVYGAESNSSQHAQSDDVTLAQECIHVAKTQNRRVSLLHTKTPSLITYRIFRQLLRDIGMDFNFLLLDLISLPAPPSTEVSQAVPEISLPETPGDTTPLSAGRPPRPPRSPAPPPRSRDREREGR